MAGGVCDGRDPGEFFSAICAKEPLLAKLRGTAEPAFMDRMAQRPFQGRNREEATTI